jgi:hypothetical protein
MVIRFVGKKEVPASEDAPFGQPSSETPMVPGAIFFIIMFIAEALRDAHGDTGAIIFFSLPFIWECQQTR